MSDLTGGAFDITVGPLVDAWGFGPPGHPPAAPAEADLARLRDQVGWQQVAVDAAGSTIRKRAPRVSADLSALAKGYAVDQVAELLAREGFSNHLVEVGGEVRAGGRSARDETWRVGIERPSAGPPAVYRTVALSGQALATSGDYRNTYLLDGLRVSHTIDPHTGRPVTHALASTSVIDPLCVRADAIATALMVLGPDDGYALAVEQNWPAFFIVRRPGRHAGGTRHAGLGAVHHPVAAAVLTRRPPYWCAGLQAGKRRLWPSLARILPIRISMTATRHSSNPTHGLTLSPGSGHLAWHSRGYHPHLDAAHVTQNITFRLADSVPASLINRWRAALQGGAARDAPADLQVRGCRLGSVPSATTRDRQARSGCAPPVRSQALQAA